MILALVLAVGAAVFCSPTDDRTELLKLLDNAVAGETRVSWIQVSALSSQVDFPVPITGENLEDIFASEGAHLGIIMDTKDGGNTRIESASFASGTERFPRRYRTAATRRASTLAGLSQLATEGRMGCLRRPPAPRCGR